MFDRSIVATIHYKYLDINTELTATVQSHNNHFEPHNEANKNRKPGTLLQKMT